MRVRIAAALVCMGLVVAAAASDPAPPNQLLAAGGFPRDLMTAPVSGEPFSAVWTNEVVKTLADGTKITGHGHHFVARDSAGRERLEIQLPLANSAMPQRKLVMVTDPVAHTVTSWIEGGTAPKVATVATRKDRTGIIQPVANPAAPAAQSTREPLGTQMIDGVLTTGELVTTVIPAGRMGNDRPMTSTHESWTSADMKLVLLQKWVDPRTGVRTTHLADFSRSEPSATLFQPPPGYAVKTIEQTLRETADKLAAQFGAQE